MYENISWMFATLGEEGAPVILFQIKVAFGQLKDVRFIVQVWWSIAQVGRI